MRKSLLDILACPIDKHNPLDLYDISLDSTSGTVIPKGNGRNSNDKLLDEKMINQTGKIDSGESKAEIISDGLLFCTRCSRFYPIIEEIPIMLPDNLRDREKDLEFLQKWSYRLPERITKQAKP